VRADDVIISMNGTPVREMDRGERIAALRGSPLELTVRRDGEKHELTLTLD
jgi:S1-C subfamily serine protease